ncbi:hypothetical protein [Paenibacillus lemnae]|uniref:Uncharacterized protein n=1 Tax=Paenibacillus lemnae TaxID=1330551 RepID=A0A848MB96_PAELE|nr:hypothetical protein [Paenibacillus lemnae]NMO97461.1 hypothetical protein [Paenibacillus lemnae]
MSKLEKEIAEQEMLTPLFSYPYQVVAISDQAKTNFGLSLKKGGPLEKLKDLFKRAEELHHSPFVGQRTFYYDDPNEPEKDRIEATKELAKHNMAYGGIMGISYRRNGYASISHATPLEEGKDYKIKVGEKIIHEQPEKLTFDDIKAL